MSDVDVMDPKIVDVTKTNKKLQQPKMYQVVFLNDDFTPMEFVRDMLMQYHSKSEQDAEIITQEVHTKGKSVAGVYTHEIAETKVHQVNIKAEASQYSLKTIMEEVS